MLREPTPPAPAAAHSFALGKGDNGVDVQFSQAMNTSLIPAGANFVVSGQAATHFPLACDWQDDITLRLHVNSADQPFTLVSFDGLGGSLVGTNGVAVEPFSDFPVV